MIKFKSLCISLSVTCILTATGLFFSCGDSAVTQLQNSGSLTVNGLKSIDKNTTGADEMGGGVLM